MVKKKSDIFYSHRCFGNHEIRRIPSGAYRWYLHTKGDGAAHPQGSRWDGCWWTVTPTGYSSLLLLRKFQGKGRHSTQTASVVTHAYQPSITQALAAFSHPQPPRRLLHIEGSLCCQGSMLVLILAEWMDSVAGFKLASSFQGQR